MNSYFQLCPLCGQEAQFSAISPGDAQEITCKVCGKFSLTGSMAATVNNLDARLRQKIGFWTRDQNELGEAPVVNTGTDEFVRRIPDKTVMERAERLLQEGIKLQRDLGSTFNMRSPELIGVTHSRSINDVVALADLLWRRGLLYDTFKNGNVAQVTPDGFIHANTTNTTASANGFIAMWFNRSMDAARDDGLDPAIRSAGYTPVIVSGVEHINKIDDEIIAQIRRSKFLVADFTGHRGGVYFEAGFAMGLGLPVFWTCRQDELDKLHFDIRQYNCIDWVDPPSLRTRLARRIEAVLGRGPIVTPQNV
jgi:hypothetical protein